MKTKFWKEYSINPEVSRIFMGKEDAMLVVFPDRIYLFRSENEKEIKEALKKGKLLPELRVLTLTRKRLRK